METNKRRRLVIDGRAIPIDSFGKKIPEPASQTVHEEEPLEEIHFRPENTWSIPPKENTDDAPSSHDYNKTNRNILEAVFSTPEKRNKLVNYAKYILNLRLGPHISQFSDDIIHSIALRILEMIESGNMKHDFSLYDQGEERMAKYIRSSIFWGGIDYIRTHYPTLFTKDTDRKNVTAHTKREARPLNLKSVYNYKVAYTGEPNDEDNEVTVNAIHDDARAIESRLAAQEILQILYDNPWIAYGHNYSDSEINRKKQYFVIKMFEYYLKGDLYTDIAKWAYPDQNPEAGGERVRKNIDRLREKLIEFLSKKNNNDEDIVNTQLS